MALKWLGNGLEVVCTWAASSFFHGLVLRFSCKVFGPQTCPSRA